VANGNAIHFIQFADKIELSRVRSETGNYQSRIGINLRIARYRGGDIRAEKVGRRRLAKKGEDRRSPAAATKSFSSVGQKKKREYPRIRKQKKKAEKERKKVT